LPGELSDDLAKSIRELTKLYGSLPKPDQTIMTGPADRSGFRSGFRCVPADVPQAAAVALGPPRDADGPAVVDEPVTEVAAFLRRNDFPELALDLRGLFYMVHQAEQIAEADAVCVGDDRGFPEDVTHHRDWRFFCPRREGRGAPGRSSGPDRCTFRAATRMHFRDIAGLARAEAAGADDFFDLFWDPPRPEPRRPGNFHDRGSASI
jgi:hypothetical protein